jgi:hypothetical protein
MGFAVTETRYSTDVGNGVVLSDGDPEKAVQYLVAEGHAGFFSVAWPSPLTCRGALERFLVTWPSDEPHRGKGASGIIVGEHGAHKIALGRAIRQLRLQGSSVQLFRLEYPDYTFVWQEPSDDDSEGLAEVGIMCANRNDPFVTALVRGTATKGVAAQAERVVRRAVEVVAPDGPPARVAREENEGAVPREDKTLPIEEPATQLEM